jgi:RHS repeat-associated protein
LTLLENKKGESDVISNYLYDLGRAGNRKKVTENTGRTVDYGYDSLYRILSETIHEIGAPSPRQISYAYDSVGNRLTKTDGAEATTYTYNDNDELETETIGPSVTNYSYDSNGNTSGKTGPDGATTYTWDQENRMTGSSLSGGQNVAYQYDDEGIRVSSSVNGAVTKFLVDKNQPYAQVLEEYSGNILNRVYTYGDDLISKAIPGTHGSNVSFYHYDGQMSTRQLTGSSGTSTDKYNYDAFGVLLASTGSTANNYLYAGEQLDANVGLYYFRSRYYNQSTGRFASLDTFHGIGSDPASLHKYAYAASDPVNKLDPTGKFWGLSAAQSVAVLGLIGILAVIGISAVLPSPIRPMHFIMDNKNAIRSSATHYALEPELVAAIILAEMGGHQSWLETATDFYFGLFGLRDTTIGPGQILISTGNELLGGPNAVPPTFWDRWQIVAALKDAETNIELTARYIRWLADLGADLGKRKIEPQAPFEPFVIDFSVLSKPSNQWGSTPGQHAQWIRLIGSEYTSAPWDPEIFKGYMSLLVLALLAAGCHNASVKEAPAQHYVLKATVATRGKYIDQIQLYDGLRRQRVIDEGSISRGLSLIDANRRYLVYSSQTVAYNQGAKQEIIVYDLERSKVIQRYANIQVVPWCLSSTNCLAFTRPSQNGLYIAQVEVGNPVFVDMDFIPSILVWSPNGKILSFVEQTGDRSIVYLLRTIDVSKGLWALKQLGELATPVEKLVWVDDQTLAYFDARDIFLLAVAGAPPVKITTDARVTGGDILPSKHGSELVWIGCRSTASCEIIFYDVRSKTRRSLDMGSYVLHLTSFSQYGLIGIMNIAPYQPPLSASKQVISRCLFTSNTLKFSPECVTNNIDVTEFLLAE